MPTLLIQHQVRDFEHWKRAFDSDPVGRAANGVRRHTVFRAADDPLTVIVHLDFESHEALAAFRERLREVWKRVGSELGFGGADGVTHRVLDEVERVEY